LFFQNTIQKYFNHLLLTDVSSTSMKNKHPLLFGLAALALTIPLQADSNRYQPDKAPNDMALAFRIERSFE